MGAFHSTYLQKRQAGHSYREFQRLWRSHGDFAASIPAFWDNVTRYVHNDPVENIGGLPGVTDEYDGVGELYYTDFDTWVSMRDVMIAEVAPDGKRVFAGPPQSVRGERHDYQPISGLFKLFTLARFNDNDARSRIDALAQQTLACPEFGGRLSGFTITLARQPSTESGMLGVAQTSSSHDVMLVHHFDSEMTARAALNSADHARLEVAQADLFDWSSRIMVLTRSWVLKGDNS